MSIRGDDLESATMRGETIRLAKELLWWRDHLKTTLTADTLQPRDLIPYKKLCERAGVPDAYPVVGDFLGELASWCISHNLPPLNSLAINGLEHKPGPGYDRAEGCSEINWWKEVLECFAADYPPKIS
jgi:hypothetical protein